MMASTRAELRRLLRWPAMWVLCGSWVLLNLAFGYVFSYLTYRGNGGPLAEILPPNAPVVMVQGMPMFGGALLMILGALTVGSGYGWGTWKTVFTTGPRRLSVLGGTLLALTAIVVVLTVVTLAADLGASFLIAAVENQPATWPSLVDVAQGFGSALLIGGMWAVAGILLGTLTRGPALAVGLGLVWSLVVENLLRGVATLLGPLQNVTDLLPGTAAGSLAGALGAAVQSDPNGTPGVTTILSGTTATWLLVAYLAVFAVITAFITRRRDITT